VKIFLDTRDLIDLFKGLPCSVDDFRRCLQGGGHALILSPTVVFEIAAPLDAPSSHAEVVKLLNDLESLPLVYIGDTQIPYRELRSAIDSHTAGREYVAINPLMTRFDETILESGSAPTSLYPNYGLAETVFEIWQRAPQVFHWPSELVNRLRSGMATDRSMASPPTVASNFRKKIRLDLELDEISPPPCRLDDFADWIYETPTRCPGVRLSYDVYHQLRRNVGDQPSASDFGDFAHVQCVPYVDLITLDRRMAVYVQRATRGWANDPSGKIRHDLRAVVREL